MKRPGRAERGQAVENCELPVAHLSAGPDHAPVSPGASCVQGERDLLALAPSAAAAVTTEANHSRCRSEAALVIEAVVAALASASYASNGLVRG